MKARTCATCSKPAVKGKSRCLSCLASVRKAMQKMRDARIAAGVCKDCGIRKPAKNSRRCRACIARGTAWTAALRRKKSAGDRTTQPEEGNSK